MVVPQSLKLNRFKIVKIPNNRDIFSRYGKFTPGSQAYTGDEAVNLNLDKIGGLMQADSDITSEISAIRKRQEDEIKHREAAAKKVQ